jgi:dTMP kinase
MKYNINFDLDLIQNTYPGKYYALEGIDGSGKTTQVEKLAEFIQKDNKKILITKEPTEGEIGNLIKKVVTKEIILPAMSLQYLFSADRAVHLHEVVIPALKEGKIVISDRSLWSAVAYGIADLNLQENEKERLLIAYNVLAMYGGYLVPDKTFIIDVPFNIAIERVKERKKEITIYENEEKLSKVQKEYEWMAQKFKDILLIIDGAQSIENVFSQIRSNL